MRVVHVLPEGETLQLSGRGAIGRWVAEVIPRSATQHVVLQGRGFRPGQEAQYFVGHQLLSRLWTARGRKAKLALLLLAPLVVAFNLARLPWREIDVIQVHNRPTYLLALRLLSLIKRRRPLLVLHLQNDHLAGWSPRVRRRIAACADLILTCSANLRDTVRTQVAGEIAVVYNGTAVSDAAEHPARSLGERVVLTYVGRMVPEKGVDVLLEAFERLTAEGALAELHLIGGATFSNAPSPYWQGLRSRSARREDVVWHGYQPAPLIETHLDTSDILVCPSVWAEPFGMVIVEGMAHSNCLVASRTGGIPEIIQDEETGLLVEPGNVEALTEALRHVVGNPALRLRLASAGEAAARARFSWAQIAETYDATLQVALQERRSNPGGSP
jgi:glycosyltransferase involved in cell wall biosynthesis